MIDSNAENYYPPADPNSIYFAGQETVDAQGWIIDSTSCEYIYGCTDPSA